jgi:FkbM family methyltransferase
MAMTSRQFLLRKAGVAPERAWMKLQDVVHRAGRYMKAFGAVRGYVLYLRAELGGAQKLHRSKVVSVDQVSGLRFRLRSGTSDLSVFNGVFVWNEYEWAFARPPRVIIDAGSYIGLSAAYFAMRYPDAQIVAVEPSQANFELLLENTADFRNIHAVRAALWTHSGTVTLSDPGCDAWGLRVGDSTAAETQPAGEVVPAVTVPDLIARFGLDRIDLLKVDIEGSEKEIFADSRAWIDQVDAICLELHDRFKPGCSRSFFAAVGDFPVEAWRGEHVLVLRERSRLVPVEFALATS